MFSEVCRKKPGVYAGVYADMQACRIAGMQTCRNAEMQACRHEDMQTYAEMQNCRHADMQKFNWALNAVLDK